MLNHIQQYHDTHYTLYLGVMTQALNFYPVLDGYDWTKERNPA